MNTYKSIFATTCLFLTCHVVAADDSISFNRDIRPILSDRCFHCHGPDAENQESEFRLDTEEHAKEDLGGYAGIVSGNLEASELHLRIRSDDDGDRMPPPEAVRQLTENEKDLLDRWIQQGAKFETHWAFKPVAESIAVPERNDWSANEIDAFVHQAIRANAMTPNQRLSKAKWLRKVTFDLTGLPPTLEELEAFQDDGSAEAYSKVVDRLLDSDAYAERMTSEWLDVARYSDSYGYQRDDYREVWHYRDWVIKAFRQNMPYDQFVTEQLAGDLLPNASRDQILATAFNRLHSHKKEGGSDPEEFRTEYVADRVNTFGAAFMGLTLECAKCHDHKYDPVKTQEYYELGSFFSSIDEYGIISYFTSAVPTPAMPLPSEQQARQIQKAKELIARHEAKYRELALQDSAAFESFLDSKSAQSASVPDAIIHLTFEDAKLPEQNNEDEKGNAKKANRRTLENLADATKPGTSAKLNSAVDGKVGNAIHLTGDDPVEIPGLAVFSRHQPFSFSLWVKPEETNERGVIYRRSRGWDDAGHIGYELTKTGASLSAKICHFWPGNSIGIQSKSVLKANEWTHLAVTYDGSSQAAGLRLFVDGKLASTQIVSDNLTRQIKTWNGGENHLAIGTRYRDRGFKDGIVDEFQVFERVLSDLEVNHLSGNDLFSKLLSKQKEHLSVGDQRMLRQHFNLTLAKDIAAERQRLFESRKALNDLMDSVKAISIMRESPNPVSNHILVRGVYNEKGAPVSPTTPAFLPGMSDAYPRNRLGLAQWLTAPNHPLLARVTVNRYWQMMFGKGLVRTPEDFGLQGQPPTHPELLDWLSRDFIQNGWDVRRLLRQMVLSSTYRQSPIVSREQRDKDPENEWLARGTTNPLSAEMIRDNALSVSGLLVQKVGGPPVRPYDLSASYKPSKPDEGDGLYRRSLYTFWQRSAPAPVMMTMNANKRDVCRVQREITASPLQAFVLLNSPQFVEASRELATKLLLEKPDKDRDWIEKAFTVLTTRTPSPNELDVLAQMFDEQSEVFNDEANRPEAFLKTGSKQPNSSLDPKRLAAATITINAIMNLNESVRH